MKRLGKRYDDRTEYTMEVTFIYSNGESEVCEVYIPYTTFSKALKDWAYDNFNVAISGESESDIFNFFKAIGFDFDKLLEDNGFLDYCYSYYEDTPSQEADYEVWMDDFEYDNNLGKYKEEM